MISIILVICVLILLLINSLVLKRLIQYNEDFKKLNQQKAEIQIENESNIKRIEDNKKIYNTELKSLIEENKSLNVSLKYYKKQLEVYSDEKSKYYSQMDNLNHSAKEWSPENFLQFRNKVIKDKDNFLDFTGIYILENKTVDKFYVGQSISVYKRCGSHFTGEGNKDIYEDYINGDKWTIKVIALANSGFKSINALEKHFIEYHKSTYNGYNKTIGNSN